MSSYSISVHGVLRKLAVQLSQHFFGDSSNVSPKWARTSFRRQLFFLPRKTSIFCRRLARCWRHFSEIRVASTFSIYRCFEF